MMMSLWEAFFAGKMELRNILREEKVRKKQDSAKTLGDS